uniref:Uncharacterized protein n=1 Tax=Yoonia rhodophyticola TaxID=3137370 RepID=A0AAN0MCM8_9RHOB
MLNAPDSWPDRKLVVTGQTGCGKSHLARIFADGEQARIINAAALAPDFQPKDQNIVVEDMETLPPHRKRRCSICTTICATPVACC